MTNSELQKNRFIAVLIDFLIAGALYVIFLILSLVLSLVHNAVGALVGIVGAAVVIGFFLARDIILSGNSIGKKLMKIKTISKTGEPITMVQSAKRNFVFAVPYLFLLIQNFLNFLGSLFPSIFTCMAGILALIIWLIQLLVALAVLGFIIWEIITITKEPDGIRWGDTFAETRVVMMPKTTEAAPADTAPPTPPSSSPPPSTPPPPPPPSAPPSS